VTVTREQEIARYVDGVRKALGDLPPAVRDELLEDLPEHLAEVAAEGTGSLVDRLGPPDAYAAELRATAGVGTPTATPNLDARISAAAVKVRARLRHLDTRTGPLIGYAKASDFLRLLRPGWWVLRGYLAAMLITVMHANNYGLLPQFDDSVVAGLLLLAVAVACSIWLGRRKAGLSRWPRLAVNAGNALAIVFGLAILVNFESGGPWHSRYPDYQRIYDTNPYSQVQDVYVYDSQGRLVEGARLFDQNGAPIRLGGPWCPEAQYQPSGEPEWRGYPYCPQRAPFRFGPEPVPSSTPEPVPSPTAATPKPSGSATGSPTPSETGSATPTG